MDTSKNHQSIVDFYYYKPHRSRLVNGILKQASEHNM